MPRSETLRNLGHSDLKSQTGGTVAGFLAAFDAHHPWMPSFAGTTVVMQRSPLAGKNGSENQHKCGV